MNISYQLDKGIRLVYELSFLEKKILVFFLVVNSPLNVEKRVKIFFSFIYDHS
jgi:hypothetical protein